MEMSGERLISAPKATVWKALNDPQILKASIPGCEQIDVISETEMTAIVAIKLGPISARFSGRVKLSDIDAPNSYTLSGEGKGGPADFAKGAAKVKLSEQPEGTLLQYTVDAQVGGKLAQLGARLIDTTAKSMADQFFTRFVDQVQAPATPEGSAAPVPAQPEPNHSKTVWIMLAIGTAIAVIGWLLAG